MGGRTIAALVLPPALFLSDRQVRYSPAPVTSRFTRWITDDNSTAVVGTGTSDSGPAPADRMRTIAKVIFLSKLGRKMAGPHGLRFHCEDCVSARPTNHKRGYALKPDECCIHHVPESRALMFKLPGGHL
jgi:hypothetical protein